MLSQSNCGFFFINLDRDQERCAHMLRSAWMLNLQFIRVSAVDLAELSQSPPMGFSPFRFSNERWTLRPFEIAVFESHRRAWETFLATEHDLGVIMEDDMLFGTVFSTTVSLLTKSRCAFDIVKLNHSNRPKRLGRPIKGFRQLTLRPIHETIADAGCYLVTREAAKALLAQSTSYCSHLDDFVFSPDRRLRSYQLIPPVSAQMIYLAAQDQTLTNISNRLDQSDRASKGPLTYRIWKELRRIVKKGYREVISRGRGGRRTDMAALLADFKPLASN